MKYILSLFLLCLHFSAFADVLVLSNRPLYDLLNDLKTSRLELRLIAQQSSVHRQEIRPAEIKIIDEADIFLLIKPFDNSIEKIAKNQKKPILIANDLSNHILPLRHHNHSDNNHEDMHDEDNHDTLSDYHEQDPHLWLSPLVTRDIIAALKQQNPSWINEQKYTEFLQYTHEMQKKIPLQNKQPHWLVYHDAWQYLEDFFGLSKPVVFTENPEAILRPKDFQNTLKHNKRKAFTCIIVEPATPERSLRKISTSFMGEIITLDPSGKTAPQGVNSLYWIWKSYRAALEHCQNHPS